MGKEGKWRMRTVECRGLWLNSSQKEEASETGRFQAGITEVPVGRKSSSSRNQNGTRENPGAKEKTGHHNREILGCAGYDGQAVCRLLRRMG